MSISFAVPSSDSLQTYVPLKILFDSPKIINFSSYSLSREYYNAVSFTYGSSFTSSSLYQGSCYFDGNSGLGFNNSSAFNFGSSDFCVEAWVKVDANSGGFRCIASTIRDTVNSVAGGGALVAGIGGWGSRGDEGGGGATTTPGGSGILGQGGAGSGSYLGGGGGGGGGGYYGGGGGCGGGGAGGWCAGGGGGGSNFISTSFTNTISKKGSESFTLPDGSTSTGNTGNGYARITRTSDNTVTNFSFTGSLQTFTVPADDNYIIEVWGAQGKGSTAVVGKPVEGGRGGYCKGTIFLTAGTVLNIYVGGQNGYNGGGAGGISTENGGSGGGATDVRLGGNTLSDRIIVAGGGGGTGGAGNLYISYSQTPTGKGGAAGENGFSPNSPYGWALFVDETAKCFWAYITYTDGSYDMVRENADPLDTTVWNHVALVRYGSTISLYRNGTKTGEVNCGTKSLKTNSSGYCYIGCYRDDEGGRATGLLASLKGNLNDVRITIGNARYTSNFTPSALGTSSHTINLNIGDTITFTAPKQNFDPYQEPFSQKFILTFTAPKQNFDPYQEPFSQKFILTRTDETLSSPKNLGVVTGLPRDTSGSQHFAGFGKIYGVVTENAQPISCMLRLYDYVSGALVAITHSASDGSYQFGNVDMSRIYTLVAYNPSKNYNSIIRDLIKPERI
jgi:hypothetical protein